VRGNVLAIPVFVLLGCSAVAQPGSSPIEPEMVVIPEGRFRMGCVSNSYCRKSEKPVREVTIESFALSKYEVTFDEYDRFTDSMGRGPVEDLGWGRGRRPVVAVSFEDAAAYAQWLSAQTGKRYRLPTEAEWEYAARAGSRTMYHFGNDESQLCCYANYGERTRDGHKDWKSNPSSPFSDEQCLGALLRRTNTVGSYWSNAFGLHDMHGNVAEWVQDCWIENYRGAPTDGSPWTEGDCAIRVTRGGSWWDRKYSVRSATRFPRSSGYRSDQIGFRLARTLTP